MTEAETLISLQALCNRLKPITLGEMKRVRLMNRTDTKYLASSRLLPDLLEFAAADFRIQELNGQFISRYSTQYYDTADLEMYTLHQNGKLPREKIRVRTYVDSNIHYLEIKKKSNKGRTEKTRVQMKEAPEPCGLLDCEWHDFIGNNSSYDASALFPHINTNFERITLVNNNLSERITLDVNLKFINCRNDKQIIVTDLMIIELKQDGRVHSRMKDFLLENRIRPIGISKYCLGTITTDPKAKSNRFRVKLRYINKLIHTNNDAF